MENTSSQSQNIHVGGCIYDSNGDTKVQWRKVNISFLPHQIKTWDFYVKEATFSTMSTGKYKIQFWINDAKIQKEFFHIKN